jgi:chromate transporter
LKASLREWTLLNLRIGAFSFGGSSRMMMYQDAIVHEHGWITNDEFAQYLTIAQILPGPNLINMSVYLGYRLCGPLGTVLGLLGLALPGATLAVLVAASLPLNQPDLNELLRGVSIGSFAMMAVFLWNLSQGLRRTAIPKLNVPLRKLLFRIGLALGVGVLSLLGIPLNPLIAGGAVVCVAVEFLT